MTQSDPPLLLSVCASVARLNRRIALLSRQGGKRDPSAPLGAPLDAWRVHDLDPPSAWLTGTRPELMLNYVLDSSSTVVAALLTAAEAGELDLAWACRMLQHLAPEAPHWTPPVRRLAVRWHVALPPSPVGCLPPLAVPPLPKRTP